jgi:hypothetical protein
MTIMQGTVEGGRKRGRQKKNWQDNVKEWTDLTIPDLIHTTNDRPLWRRISASSALRYLDNSRSRETEVR